MTKDIIIACAGCHEEVSMKDCELVPSKDKYDRPVALCLHCFDDLKKCDICDCSFIEPEDPGYRTQGKHLSDYWPRGECEGEYEDEDEWADTCDDCLGKYN